MKWFRYKADFDSFWMYGICEVISARKIEKADRYLIHDMETSRLEVSVVVVEAIKSIFCSFF